MASIYNCYARPIDPSVGATIQIGVSSTQYTGKKNDVTYYIDGRSGTIVTGAADVFSRAWTIPESFMDIISQSGTECSINFRCYQEDLYGHQTTLLTETVSITVYPPADASPTVYDGWFTVERDNSGSAASSITEWVKGYSKARVTFDPTKVTPNHGATIAKFSVEYNGEIVDAVSNVSTTQFLIDTNSVINISVTDSRGYRTNEAYTIQLLDYAPPTITAVEAFRSDSLKQPYDAGTYITARATAGCTSLNGKNTATLKASYKPSGATDFGAEQTIQSGVQTIIASAVSDTSSYIVRLRAVDSLGNTAEFRKTISTKEVAFHLRAGGRGAAFGKVNETENALELAAGWKLKIGSTAITEAQLQALLNLL